MPSAFEAFTKSDLFKDYDFEGSNTSLLIEFVAYMSELNTYYLNKNLNYDV